MQLIMEDVGDDDDDSVMKTIEPKVSECLAVSLLLGSLLPGHTPSSLN